MALLFLARDLADDELAALQRRLDRPRLLFVPDLGLLVPDPGQPGQERRRIAGLQFRREGPVLLGLEVFDLLLAVDDHLHRHRLHATGAETAADLVPHQRGELVADEPVEDAPGLLRVDLVHVDLGGMLDVPAHRVAGDLMEEDAADFFRVAAEEVHHMPADGLPLAVGVGGDVNGVGFLCRRLQLADDLLFSREHFVGGLEGFLVDAQLALGKIADVSHRRLDDVVLPDELVDRLRFCGRFDDDEISGPCGTGETDALSCKIPRARVTRARARAYSSSSSSVSSVPAALYFLVLLYSV